MFDAIRNQYRLRCPSLETHVWVAISSFRTIRRLRGAQRPAVFRVGFDCECGSNHEALISHDRLDYEPIAGDSTQTFTNLLTGSRELVGVELADTTATLIRSGSWPWTFWCHPESAPRPGFPSSLRMVSPEHNHGDERVGVLVRCFSCARMTVNLVTRDHLDVPFYNDRHIGFIPEVFRRDALEPDEIFRHQLDSGAERSAWLRDVG
jgi:hypothetical protein